MPAEPQQPAIALKRQNLVKKMALLLIDDMREREAIIGLTVAKDFKSRYAKIKADRERKAKKIEGVSVYDGRVPIH